MISKYEKARVFLWHRFFGNTVRLISGIFEPHSPQAALTKKSQISWVVAVVSKKNYAERRDFVSLQTKKTLFLHTACVCVCVCWYNVWLTMTQPTNTRRWLVNRENFIDFNSLIWIRKEIIIFCSSGLWIITERGTIFVLVKCQPCWIIC